MKERHHPSILTTSATLLGFCFVVLTSVNDLKLASANIIDVLAIIAITFFTLSCVMSFFALRISDGLSITLEKTADIIFLLGLATIFGSTIYYTVNVFK